MPLWFSPVAHFHQCQPVADCFLSLSVTECLQVRVVLSRPHPTRSSPTHYGLTCWLKRIKIHKLESRRGTPLELDSHTAQHSAGDADGSVARRELTGVVARVSQVHSQSGGIQEMSKNYKLS